VVTSHHVIVVGAGFGGLSAAIDLAAAGVHVTVVERAARAGGKAASVVVAGRAVDTGPTVCTMRWVFDELFAAASRAVGDYVRFEPVGVLARHAWPDGARLDLFADVERSSAAIAAEFGAAEAVAYRRFAAHTEALFATIERPFLRAQRPDLMTAMREVSVLGLGALVRLDALRTMARSLERTFQTPHLRQLFGRYATYCGSSPYEAPATLNLIAHVERLGVQRVEGGISALAAALERLARELGVELVFGAEVDQVLVAGGEARGVRMRDGARLLADAVVFNGDVASLPALLDGPDAARAVRATLPEERSLSAVTWALAAHASGFPLAHHNVFFSSDPAGEFRVLADARGVPDGPTAYVCAQARGDDAAAAGGEDEPCLVVVNAPPTGGDAHAWNDEVIERWERATFSTLKRCGLTLTPRAALVTTPADFERRFPATGGALYGPRATGAFSPLVRQPASSRVSRLYVAGGSVHPGPGVPMAAISGRLAASRVREGLASMPRSRPAATSGTMSMR
jgi:1-hydroxycarotenoid 3,4-desaturase